MNPRFSRGDKIATGFARAIAFVIGMALVFAFVAGGIWRSGGVEGWLAFGFLTGLCLGYGIGGDALGARLASLFHGGNLSRLVAAEKAGAKVPNYLQKFTLLLLVGILLLIIGLSVFVWLRR